MARRFNTQTSLLIAAVMLGLFSAGTAIAQSQLNTPAQAPPVDSRQPGPNLAGVATQPPFAIQYQAHLTIREDRTATEVGTKRIKILSPSAIQTLSQQQLTFIAGMQSLETVEAYTQKADGRRIPVDPANIINRDAASGLQATYVPDLKQRTIVFPDVSLGDTLVMTNRLDTLQGEFSGQFMDSDIYPRSLPLSSIELTVEAPATLDVAVKATGSGATDEVAVTNGIRRHLISIVPQSYQPEEPGSVSPLDRDPAVLVSTFHSYEELGMAYGKAALPKAEVTPEIAALADDITRGVSGHRAQAVAIDAWMKKNIRYVAIFLSVGRVVPHDAAAILRNGFGDCKDKVTLMSALLGAKGIASEPALINLGNIYSLPEPPTLAALNHVILYLPEFDLYDDPTSTGSAFGVLAPEGYDKPVVRVIATGAEIAHTPAMQPNDHIGHTTTAITLAADGTVTGQTEESNVGTLAAGLRFAGSVAQQVGDETLAQRQLQFFSTPGTGQFELGSSAELLDPAVIKGSFTLNDHFKRPAPGSVVSIPVGMPLTLRPGNFLLGTRLSGRKSAFVCYAGTQIEDIEVTFDPALPMPLAFTGLTIDNPLFTYRSTYKVEGRTFRIHRELVSRVPHQVCPPEAETLITADLNRVRVDVYGGYRFAAPVTAARPKPQSVANVPVTVNAGQKKQLSFIYQVNIDCSVVGFATITLAESPQHGKYTLDRGTDKTNFPQSNPRSACNSRQTEGQLIAYEPNSGFSGTDALTIEIAYVGGGKVRRHYAITVNPVREAAAASIVQPNVEGGVPVRAQPAPSRSGPTSATSPLVITRVAVADKPLQVAFLYDLNPDCSLVGIATVRISEQPKSGKVTVETAAGFPRFPAKNSRFKCNTNRVDGTAIFYTPNPGYTGADSITVDIIYPDGTASKRRYAIEVR